MENKKTIPVPMPSDGKGLFFEPASLFIAGLLCMGNVFCFPGRLHH
jgi:hypothetical protein